MSGEQQYGPTPYDRIDWDQELMYPARYQAEGASTSHAQPGYLGLKNEQLVFKFQDKHTTDLEIPLENVTYFGIRWQEDAGSPPYLTVHCPDGDDWTIHAFELAADHRRELLRLVQLWPDVPLASYPDFGPAEAQPMHQITDGEWHAQPMVDLYLAPDYLLMSGKAVLAFDQIIRLTLTQEIVRVSGEQQNTLQPTTLLGIDYLLPDASQPVTIVFQFSADDPQTWATLLQVRTGIDQIEWERHPMYPAWYYGPDSAAFRTKKSGYFDLRNDQLVFKFQDKDSADLEIPLASVAFFGTRHAVGGRFYLTVHCPDGANWLVYNFNFLTTKHWDEFRDQLLQTYPDVPFAPDPDYGPNTAHIYEQDIYGAWHEQGTIILYLAPDRLLARRQTLLMLDQITKLALVPKISLTDEFEPRMLRIDYRLPNDPRPQAIGLHFLHVVPHRWGDMLSQRTQIPLEVKSSRKKKKP